jgi:hypothetical protein
MPSVLVSWRGSCPERDVRDALLRRLEPIAALSHGYFDEPPTVALFDGRIEGRVVVSERVVDGCEEAVAIPDEDDAGLTSNVEARPGLSDTPITIGGPLYSIPFVDLHGITFRLYDGRELYSEEDLLSFVFTTFPGDGAPFTRMVEVLPADQHARATPAAVRGAACCLLRPSIRLRYYCEQWVNLLLGSIKYFSVPDLAWRGYEDCAGYLELQALYEQRHDDGTLADFAFQTLATGLRREVESSSGEAAAVRSFWGAMKDQRD